MIGGDIMIRSRNLALCLTVLVLFLPTAGTASDNSLWDSALAAYKRGDNDAAVAAFSKIIEQQPKIIEQQPKNAGAYELLELAYHYRAFAHSHKGEYDRAIADYSEVIRLDPKYEAAYLDRGRAYCAKGRYDQAIADYSEGIRLNPENMRTYNDRAGAYFAKDDYNRAIADFSEVIRLTPKPNAWLGYLQRGSSYSAMRDYDRAIADYNEAISLAPKEPWPYSGRGYAYYAQGKHDRAVADYEIVARLYREKLATNPKDIVALSGVAWMLATCPEGKFRNGAKALEYATKYCESIPQKDAFCLDTMAAAYAESGNFDRAIETERQAISEYKGENPGFRKRLQVYQSRKPYRADIK